MDFSRKTLPIKFLTIALLSTALSACVSKNSPDAQTTLAPQPGPDGTEESPVFSHSSLGEAILPMPAGTYRYHLQDYVKGPIFYGPAVSYESSLIWMNKVNPENALQPYNIACGYAEEDGEPDDDYEDNICEDENNDILFTDGNDGFVVETYCSGALETRMAITKVSDEEDFRSSVLNIRSMQYDVVASDADACAIIHRVLVEDTQEATDEPEGQLTTPSSSSITLATPFRDDIVELRMSFLYDVAPGRYEIGVRANNESGTRPASAQLISSEFGGTPEAPLEIAATGGWIEITSAELASVIGELELTTDSGDTINGSFHARLD